MIRARMKNFVKGGESRALGLKNNKRVIVFFGSKNTQSRNGGAIRKKIPSILWKFSLMIITSCSSFAYFQQLLASRSATVFTDHQDQRTQSSTLPRPPSLGTKLSSRPKENHDRRQEEMGEETADTISLSTTCTEWAPSREEANESQSACWTRRRP